MEAVAEVSLLGGVEVYEYASYEVVKYCSGPQLESRQICTEHEELEPALSASSASSEIV